MIHRIARTVFASWIVVAAAFGADISGIWVGQQEGRNGQMEDIAFRFKVTGDSITGTMFGDEFDLAVENATVTGDQIAFTVTSTNYYSRNKMTLRFSGKITGSEMELLRERVLTEQEKAALNRRPDRPNRPDVRQTLKLKRLT